MASHLSNEDLNRLEPVITGYNILSPDSAASVSQAISLKRIADTLEELLVVIKNKRP